MHYCDYPVGMAAALPPVSIASQSPILEQKGCLAMIQRFSFALTLLMLHALPLFSQAPPTSLTIAKVEIDSTYDTLFQPQQRGWLGADGAASIPLDDKHTLWIFGDTTLGTQRGGKREGPMVNNTIAIQDRTGGAPGTVAYHWDFTDNLPGSFFHDGYDAPHWFWPGTGVMYNGRLFLFLTKVSRGDGDAGFGFKTIGCVLFRVENPMAPPTAWQMHQTDLGLGDDHFNINAAALIEGDYLYLLGYSDPGNKPADRVAILARLPLAALTASEPAKSLEYWSEGDAWKADRAALKPLFRPGQTETSLQYDPVRRRYIAVVLQPFQPDMCLVSAESLTGSWTEPQKVYDIPDYKINNLVHAYAGRSHPELAASPDELIITYVSNTSDFWGMFGMMNIYYPRFVRVQLEPVAAPTAAEKGTPR